MAWVSRLFLLLCVVVATLGDQESGEWTYPPQDFTSTTRETAYDTSNSHDDEVQRFLRVPQIRRRREAAPSLLYIEEPAYSETLVNAPPNDVHEIKEQVLAPNARPSSSSWENEDQKESDLNGGPVIKSSEDESFGRAKRGVVLSRYWPNVNDPVSHKNLKYPVSSNSVNDVLKGDDFEDEPFASSYLTLKEQIADGEDKLNKELKGLLLDDAELKSRGQPLARLEDRVEKTKSALRDGTIEHQQEQSVTKLLDLLALFAEEQAGDSGSQMDIVMEETDAPSEQLQTWSNPEDFDSQNNVHIMGESSKTSPSGSNMEDSDQEDDSWLTSVVGPLLRGFSAGRDKGSSSEEDTKIVTKDNSVNSFGDTGENQRWAAISCRFTLKMSNWESGETAQWICEEREPVSNEEETQGLGNDDDSDREAGLPILLLDWLGKSKISSEEQDGSSKGKVWPRDFHWPTFFNDPSYRETNE